MSPSSSIPSRNLANGNPSTLATWLDALDLNQGKSVFHLGCGTGYYTAIIAEIVGPRGHVTAAEIDSTLASRARETLARYPNVHVIADAERCPGRHGELVPDDICPANQILRRDVRGQKPSTCGAIDRAAGVVRIGLIRLYRCHLKFRSAGRFNLLLSQTSRERKRNPSRSQFHDCSFYDNAKPGIPRPSASPPALMLIDLSHGMRRMPVHPPGPPCGVTRRKGEGI